jgi:hypothetical protein
MMDFNDIINKAPTDVEVNEFRADIKTIIELNINSMISRKTFHIINNFIRETSVNEQTPTYVLKYIITYIFPVKEQLPFYDSFLEKTIENAKVRGEWDEDMFSDFV